MNPIFAVEHIGLAANDPRGLKEWYERVLDAELVYEMRQTPPAFLLKLGGMMIEIYAAEFASVETRKNRLAGWRHLALKVTSIDAARSALAGRGVQFSESIKPAGGGGRVFFFRIPKGTCYTLRSDWQRDFDEHCELMCTGFRKRKRAVPEGTA